MQKPYLLGIGGGTASGKTTFSHALRDALPSDSVKIIQMDWYYRDHLDLPQDERAKLNYDHPDTFDSDALIADLSSLRDGKTISPSIYDFAHHRRGSEVISIEPVPLIIIDGILLFHFPDLRNIFDLRVFLDAPDDVRFERRLKRDQLERGRSESSIRNQWKNTVAPMHAQFCEPTKKFADIIIPGTDDGLLMVPVLLERIGLTILPTERI